MYKYEVDYFDELNGSTSPVDYIESDKPLKADDYDKMCRENADAEWLSLLTHGCFTLIAL